jgi:hypothetical protein
MPPGHVASRVSRGWHVDAPPSYAEDLGSAHLAFWSDGPLPEVRLEKTGEIMVAPPGSVIVFDNLTCTHRTPPSLRGVYTRRWLIRAHLDEDFLKS